MEYLIIHRLNRIFEKYAFHGEQAVERGKGESLGSWEQKVRERKGRARRGARARRAAPDL